MSLLRLLACVAGLAFASPAFAHAVLAASTPEQGATLTQKPRRIELRFNEPVQVLVLRLIDGRGAAHELAPISSGERVEATLPDDLPEGAQLLSYRVVSLDGHPVGAALTFFIGKAGGAHDQPLDGASRAFWIWATKALVLALQLGGAGMAVFFALLSPAPPSPRFSKASAGALGFGMALSVLSMGLQGLDLLGLPLDALMQATPWRAAAGSSFALATLFELLAFSLAAIALRAKDANLAKALACAALIGAGCARAAGGHAALADPQWLMRPAVFLHTTAAAIWAGALPPLLWLALTDAKTFLTALRRFSTVALVTVQILLILGCLIAAVQAPNLAALPDTAYGRLLAVKLGLVALLLALALWNRRVATPRVLAAEKRATRLIAGSMALEIALLAGVFAVVAAWRFMPPPRAMIEAQAGYEHQIGDGRMKAQLRFSPGRAGENRLELTLRDHAAMPLEARAVTITFEAPWLGVEPSSLAAQSDGAGQWRIPAVYLPAAGLWTVTIEALISDFEKLTVSGPCEIAP